MTKIWFNRCFSTAYNIIDLIKNNNENEIFEIFVSHIDKYSINLQNADYPFVEPTLPDDEYLNYCLDICKNNSIDIFVPHHKLLLISENIAKFNI